MHIFTRIGFITLAAAVFVPALALAQAADIEATTTDAIDVATTTVSTSTLSASTTASAILDQTKNSDEVSPDTTRPEEFQGKVAILSLLESRPVEKPGLFSFMAYWVQEAIKVGIPANTIFLILLTPLLATLVSFVRVVIGLPTLDMLVPIALAFAFVAVGVVLGMLVLSAIILASYISKVSLKKVRIMFYPKRSLSMVFLALFVFAALTGSLYLDFETILNLSIFPILILMLLGDSIVSVQLHKSFSETFIITTTTLCIGLFGYVLATSTTVLNTLILYPELVLLAVPVNLLIGRYFGLRVSEVLRFNSVSTD